MDHLNDNRLCAITALLTGPDAQINDIVQICVVVLDGNFEISGNVPPFIANIAPRRGLIDKDYLKHDFKKVVDVLQHTVESDKVAELFEIWFQKIILRDCKKIMPLAYNWALLSRFLIDWLGIECFNQYFDYRYRDLIPATIYCNDRAYTKSEAYPFPKHHFSYLASTLRVNRSPNDDKLMEVIALTQIYKKSMAAFIGI